MSRSLLLVGLLLVAACDYRIVDERPMLANPLAVTPVLAPIPAINLFTGEPSRIFLGSRVTLRWDVTLPPGSPVATPIAVRVDPQPGTVATVGAASVQPFERGLFTAILTAETTGGRVSRVVQVIVD